MKEEELKQKAKERTPDYMDMVQRAIYESAYVDGAIENGVQWHDLRKDSNDLPKDNQGVWTNRGGAYHDSDGWFDDYGHVEGVIAWCMPEFKE